jgi:putative GTP pyrophosphokinase
MSADPSQDRTQTTEVRTLETALYTQTVETTSETGERATEAIFELFQTSGSITFSAEELRSMRGRIESFLMRYQFGVREIETKLSILRDEFLALHEYNPIEHISSRVKSTEGIVDKARRKQIPTDLASIQEHITDIAGVRVTCSFVSDVYHMFELLTQQDDISVVTVKDYIANPKPNGYQSLHTIMQIPVFMSSGRTDVTVEVQFRTIAMDFWASLEHKIYYKYAGGVPSRLLAELKDAADSAASLDRRMERLHRELHGAPLPD